MEVVDLLVDLTLIQQTQVHHLIFQIKQLLVVEVVVKEVILVEDPEVLVEVEQVEQHLLLLLEQEMF